MKRNIRGLGRWTSHGFPTSRTRYWHEVQHEEIIMSRLHDMKTGIIAAKQSAVEEVQKKVFGFSGKFAKTLASMNKEDPKKVRAFLNELIQDKELPYEVRTACAKLLDGFNTGMPLDKVMQQQTVESIKELETTLKGTHEGK